MIRVIEDNGGGLHITDGKLVFSGLEDNPKPDHINDIVYFADWIQDVMDEGHVIEYVRDQWTHPALTTIAEYDGTDITIHADKLGNAGYKYLGLSRPD